MASSSELPSERGCSLRPFIHSLELQGVAADEVSHRRAGAQPAVELEDVSQTGSLMTCGEETHPEVTKRGIELRRRMSWRLTGPAQSLRGGLTTIPKLNGGGTVSTQTYGAAFVCSAGHAARILHPSEGGNVGQDTQLILDSEIVTFYPDTWDFTRPQFSIAAEG